MKAVTWQGRQDMQVLDVPDPAIEASIASTARRSMAPASGLPMDIAV